MHFKELSLNLDYKLHFHFLVVGFFCPCVSRKNK